MVESHPLLILPFILLLLAMALGPVLAARWWARYYSVVALGLGAMTAGIYLFGLRDLATIAQAAHEYVSFIALIGSLFVVSGGFLIHVRSSGRPFANMIFLLAGSIAANFLGTTGAAILLIRPWIRINQKRISPYHVAFFIFLVANVGGGLTPIGDPPLFLGYLQGVPFWWLLRQGWLVWATTVALLLAIFYVLDQFHFSRAARSLQPDPTLEQGWRFAGWPNLFFLGVILAAVFMPHPIFLREGLMLAAAAGSYFTTPKTIHAANGLNFHPVNEVAILFAGIFATMPPALAWLDVHARGFAGQNPSLAIFYWGTGALSAFLDNAPTYLGFLGALRGATGVSAMAGLLDQHTGHLLAISFGAVFFGATTYIGNGPNFMVMSVAGQGGVAMPTFLGFIGKYTLPFVLPVLVIVWWLFFRG